MIPYKSLQTPALSKWVLLPLRLFLGITFIYAGVQKLADPQFFRAGAPGFIGRQIIGFATGSPLHDLLMRVALPHATFFGLLIAYGEIAIGLGALLGLLLRPAAFFGMLISIIFFLSASWHVYPYFYGSDIVFTFCWLTLLLNGPLNTGLPSIDELLTLQLIERTAPEHQESYARLLRVFLGTTKPAPESVPVYQPGTSKQERTAPARVVQQRKYAIEQQSRNARRNFLWGLVTGGASILGIGGIIYAFSVLRRDDDAAVHTPTPAAVSPTATVEGATTPATGATSTPAAGGTAIAQVSAVPVNSATQFTIPSSGDPGILVHLNNGQFVAYDALCTHAGCQVDYDPSSQLLICPCHGAEFDPAKQAEVVQSPAPTPLGAVAIQVDSATGAITLSS